MAIDRDNALRLAWEAVGTVRDEMRLRTFTNLPKSSRRWAWSDEHGFGAPMSF